MEFTDPYALARYIKDAKKATLTGHCESGP